MEYVKKELLSEGKTKRLWATDKRNCAIAEFSDDAMMYHAKKKLYFDGKGRYCNEINALLMEVLEDNNIATHYIQRYNENSIVVKKAEMIPVEVVVRNYSAGTMIKRLGLEYHKKLKTPVLEFCYKNVPPTLPNSNLKSATIISIFFIKSTSTLFTRIALYCIADISSCVQSSIAYA